MEESEKGLTSTKEYVQCSLPVKKKGNPWPKGSLFPCLFFFFFSVISSNTYAFINGPSEIQGAPEGAQALPWKGRGLSHTTCLLGTFPSLEGTGCFLIKAGLVRSRHVHEHHWWGCGHAACSGRWWVGMAAKGREATNERKDSRWGAGQHPLLWHA